MLNLIFIWDKNIQQKKKKKKNSSPLVKFCACFKFSRNSELAYWQWTSTATWLLFISKFKIATDLFESSMLFSLISVMFWENWKIIFIFAPSLFDVKKIEDAVHRQGIDCQIELYHLIGAVQNSLKRFPLFLKPEWTFFSLVF